LRQPKLGDSPRHDKDRIEVGKRIYPFQQTDEEGRKTTFEVAGQAKGTSVSGLVPRKLEEDEAKLNSHRKRIDGPRSN
jgi:hypothetical protein